ncbi:hypothetical protein O9992_29420 [Vibrio lentus]|nr:hypothetical protein [Vibrio lentus]
MVDRNWRLALADLETNAPKNFSEITEILNSMASDSMEQRSHQLSKPARGAITQSSEQLEITILESRGVNLSLIDAETLLAPISEHSPTGDDARVHEFCYEMMEAEVKKFGSLLVEFINGI